MCLKVSKIFNHRDIFYQLWWWSFFSVVGNREKFAQDLPVSMAPKGWLEPVRMQKENPEKTHKNQLSQLWEFSQNNFCDKALVNRNKMNCDYAEFIHFSDTFTDGK